MKVILRKAQNNYEIAELAETKSYYDVAVSRYYYYLYQNIIFILSQKHISSEKDKFISALPVEIILFILIFFSNDNSELKNLATFVLDNGKVEQEFLLEWYNEILNYNFREYL